MVQLIQKRGTVKLTKNKEDFKQKKNSAGVEKEVAEVSDRLRGQLYSRYRVPNRESVLPDGAVLVRFEPMAPGAKVLPNRPKGREEALGVACRFKPPHGALTLTRWLMGILGTVIQSSVLAMLHTRQYLTFGRPIASKFVCD